VKQPISLKSYLVITVFAVAVVAILLSISYQSNQSLDSSDNLKAISNAFFFPGYLLFSSGVLVIIDNYEGFDFLRYATMKFWQIVRRIERTDGPKNFYEYRTQANLREKSKMYIPLIVVGLLFVLINVVFWLIFKQMYPNI
jgi:hypothetical protein